MKNAPKPTPGQTGPRRPYPTPAIHNYLRTPVRDLRSLPIRNNPKLKLLDYRLTNAPGMVNGSIGKPRTHGHGAALLAGDILLNICLTRDDDGWYLETETCCYDEQVSGRAELDLADTLLADIYRAIQKKQNSAEAQAYGRGCGRN